MTDTFYPQADGEFKALIASVLRRVSSVIALGLFGIVLLSGPATANTQSDEAEIRKVLSQCPSPRATDCVHDDKIVVKILKIYGDYAHATVDRTDDAGEGGDIYLKKESRRWTILVEGAGVNFQELGIPKEVQ